jgi:hypothetical protein
MRINFLRLGAMAGAVLLCAGARAADNQLTPQEKSAGWRLLFDGRAFNNWEDPARKSPPGDSFTIEDGCLKATPRPRITEDLFTKDTFRDYELEWDWKISPAGNSGVKYRIQDRVFLLPVHASRFEDLVNMALKDRPKTRPDHGQEYVIGFEYQMLDDAQNPDARRGDTHRAGALYDMVAASRDMTRPVGEWNHSRLVVRGDHVEHWMNGVKVVDTSLDAPAIAEHTGVRWGVDSPVYNLLVKHPRQECPISLQNHDTAAWFKNIKIRVLK